jgi:hypothetical protein
MCTSHGSVQGRNIIFENRENKLKKGEEQKERVRNIDRKKQCGRQTELKADRRTRKKRHMESKRTLPPVVERWLRLLVHVPRKDPKLLPYDSGLCGH